jgi:hypothetical protein
VTAKWAVGKNMPGYLPETEPRTARTLQDAQSVLLADIEFDWDQHQMVCDHTQLCDLCDEYQWGHEDVEQQGKTSVSIGNMHYWILLVVPS